MAENTDSKSISLENEKLIAEAEKNTKVSKEFLSTLHNSSKENKKPSAEKSEDFTMFIEGLKESKE